MIAATPLSDPSRAGWSAPNWGTLYYERFFLFSLAAVPALSGTARGLIIPGFRLSEVITFGLLGLSILTYGWAFRLYGIGAFAIAVYCFTYSLTGLWHFNSRPQLSASMAGEEVFVVWQYLILALIAANFFSRHRSETRLYGLLVSIGIWSSIQSVIALLQIFRFRPSMALGTAITGNPAILDTPNWKVPRGTGLFNSWHAMGAFTALTLTLLLMACLSGNFIGRRQRLLLVFCVLSGVGVIASLTATPLILSGAIALILAKRYKRLRPLLALGATGTLIFLTGPVFALAEDRISRQQLGGSNRFLPQTIAFRIDVWRHDYLPIIGKHMWFGYGTRDSDTEIFRYSESMYIWLLFQGGVFLAAAFVAMVLLIAFDLSRHGRVVWPRSSIQEGTRFVAVLASLLLMPLMMIHPYLKDAGGSQLYFCLVGIAMGLVHSTGSRQAGETT